MQCLSENDYVTKTSPGTGLHTVWFSSVFQIAVYLLGCLFVCTWTGDGKSSVHALENDVQTQSTAKHTATEEPVLKRHTRVPSHEDVFKIFFPIFVCHYIHTCCTTDRSTLSDTRLCAHTFQCFEFKSTQEIHHRVRSSLAQYKNAIIDCYFTVCGRYRNMLVMTKLFVLRISFVIWNSFGFGKVYTLVM